MVQEGGTLKRIWGQPCQVRDIFPWARLLQGPPSLAWDMARDGAATTSLGSLCQAITTLTGREFIGRWVVMSVNNSSVGQGF